MNYQILTVTKTVLTSCFRYGIRCHLIVNLENDKIHGVNLRAQSSFRVEEATAKFAVLSGSDDALSLDTDTTWPTSQRTGHVTKIQPP